MLHTHPSMASSIFFFLSSISSGVSMPAGTDEKPPGVISPLKKRKKKHTKWHAVHDEWVICVCPFTSRHLCVAQVVPLIYASTKKTPKSSRWPTRCLNLKADSSFSFENLAGVSAIICMSSTCLPVWRIQFHLVSPRRSPPPPPLLMTPRPKAPVLPTVCDPPPPPLLWPERKQKCFSSFCKEPTWTPVCVLWIVCSPHLEVCRIGPEHVTIKRLAHFIYWRFPPASGMITKRTVLTGRKTRGWRSLNSDRDYFECAAGVILHLGWESWVPGSWDWGKREGAHISAWLSAREEAPCGHSGREEIQTLAACQVFLQHQVLSSVKDNTMSYRSYGHAESDTQLVGQVTRLLLFQTSFKLFSLQRRKNMQDRSWGSNFLN